MIDSPLFSLPSTGPLEHTGTITIHSQLGVLYHQATATCNVLPMIISGLDASTHTAKWDLSLQTARRSNKRSNSSGEGSWSLQKWWELQTWSHTTVWSSIRLAVCVLLKWPSLPLSLSPPPPIPSLSHCLSSLFSTNYTKTKTTGTGWLPNSVTETVICLNCSNQNQDQEKLLQNHFNYKIHSDTTPSPPHTHTHTHVFILFSSFLFFSFLSYKNVLEGAW